MSAQILQFPNLRAVPVNGVLTSPKAAKRHEVDAPAGIAAWPPAGLSQHLPPITAAAVQAAERRYRKAAGDRLLRRAVLLHLRKAAEAWPEGDGRVADLIMDALIAAEAEASRDGGGGGAA